MKNTEQLLRLPQVLEIVPISKSSLWKGISEGKFPAPVKISERISAWKLSEIMELVQTFRKEGE